MGKGLIGDMRLASTPSSRAVPGPLPTRRPDLVIGIGGYTSAPLIAAAFLLGIKRAIVEPNAYPGMANRVLSPLANIVFASFAEALPFFELGKARVVGTPIRRAFLGEVPSTEIARPDARGSLPPGNRRKPGRALDQSRNDGRLSHTGSVHRRVRLIHQTGERDFEEVTGGLSRGSSKACPSVAEPESRRSCSTCRGP